jgi:dihydropteroate synthase
MFTVNCRGRLLVINEPIVMGIINTTPDSFYQGSRASTTHEILVRAEQMLMDGATILDLGGQSTRPGSLNVGADEEMKRVIPAIEAVCKKFPEAIVSIDSYYSSVVKQAVDAGACIINDVSAGSIDSALLPMVARLQVPYVLMHMKGRPENMQIDPVYENVTLEVFDSLNFKLKELHTSGIKDVIIDPGFGFGKTIEHNFQLLRELSYFNLLNCPLMVGLSRKATVYKTLGTTADNALNGTTAIHTIALMNGANILRVHDVKEATEAIRIFTACTKKEQL